MTDEAARQRIVSDLDTTFLVEAAAGTGKTTMLVRRFVALLRKGADVAGLAAVTFTDKAAGELKVRIRGVIESERREASDAERAALGRALARLEEARISTLHTFAADLLRERPIEAGIDPRFVPSSEDDAKATFEEAFARWLEGALGRRAPAVERALARREVSVDRLRKAARDLVDHRHLGAPWRDKPWDSAAARNEALDRLQAFVTLVEPSRSKTDPFRKALAPAMALAERAHRISDAEIEAELVTLARSRDAKKPRWDRARLVKGVGRDEVKAVHEALYECLEAYARSADADLATRLRGELWGVIDVYEELKASRGILDFDDLLLRTRSLLAGDPEVRRRFAGRLTHLLVDEFQDTDPSQAAILLLLASDRPDAADPLASPPAPGKLFCVGDPKQSIYRFRHADIATYARVKELVVASGGAVLELGRSYRAVPGIQAFVNATFAPLLTGDPVSLQAAHVPLERVRGVIGDQPAVMGVPVPKPYGKNERLAKVALRASYPAALAAQIAWLIRESGYRVAQKGGGTARIGPGDICVLFRQMGGFGEVSVRELTAALTQRSIPFSVVGGSSASTGDEIRGVVAALAAVERPGDSLAVYAALHGFLFGISDESLFEYKVRYGSIDPLVRPRTELPRELSSIGNALVILGELYLRRNSRPPAETVFELLKRTRGHLSISLSANGEQTMTDLARIAHRAVAHERHGGLSFRAFIDELEESMVQGASGEWDENATGVRIMTAHRAKGLEFPVVAIGDPASAAARAPDRVVDVREEVAALELAGLAPWELLERAELETDRLAS
ncbi:MAG: UvrD-helicase domain-containing protein [Polyangiaceae bacterium]|nr:UvrD-helicase domain-containing protein [Polyangiaceae bacterium]